VDVTLAVCELPQKLCSNVNISASKVPKGFLARVKIPIISVGLLLHFQKNNLGYFWPRLPKVKVFVF